MRKVVYFLIYVGVFYLRSHLPLAGFIAAVVVATGVVLALHLYLKRGDEAILKKVQASQDRYEYQQAKKATDAKDSSPLERQRLQKLNAERLALAASEPGGEAERPIEVSSAALVEPIAAGLGCPVCAGWLRLVSHNAVTVNDVSLRQVLTRCAECEGERQVWIRIVAPMEH